MRVRRDEDFERLMHAGSTSIVDGLGHRSGARSARAWRRAMAIYQEEIAVVALARSWLGCGARCGAPSPSGCCCSPSTRPRSGWTRSAPPTTAATSRTTCWRRSRSSRTATSTCATSTPSAPTPTSTPTSSTATGAQTEGRLNEPHGVGFPLLIAPAYALGGAKGVELFLAAIAALGGGARLPARAAGGARPVGARRGARRRAQPAVPRLRQRGLSGARRRRGARGRGAAGAAAGRARRRAAEAFGCFALLGALPWLGTKFVPGGRRDRRLRGARALAGAPPDAGGAGRRAVAVQRRALRGDQRGALRRADALRGRRRRARPRPTPASRAATSSAPTGWSRCSSTATTGCCAGRRSSCSPSRGCGGCGARTASGWRARCPRSARARLAAALCAAALGAQLLVAAFLAPTMFGFWFPPRHLLAGLPLAIPLVAWGLRHLPRVGQRARRCSRCAASAWLYADVRWGGGSLAADRPDAPFGPAHRRCSRCSSPAAAGRSGSPARSARRCCAGPPRGSRARHSRQSAGATRARYSG